MTQFFHTKDHALVSLGFAERADGTLRAPDNSVLTLIPIGNFYELRVTLGGGSIHAVMAKTALRIVHKES